MIYGSVCSGIEAATVAWHGLGWKPAFFSEIEAFPRAVLAHHYPDAPLHGDFTTIEDNSYAAINLLVGGTPCQAFSVAGLRKGFDDERGNLTLEFVRLAQRLRPKWLVWENVPGVLSIDGGRAFGSFLGGLAELGYGFAYRVLDAQYFGVPQRRRRVFVVGYFGDWRPAAAVLFERDSLSGHPAPSREAGQDIAGTFTSRAKSGGWSQDVDLASSGYMQVAEGGVAKCLTSHGMRLDAETENLLATNGGGFDVTHALTRRYDSSEDGCGRGTPLVACRDVYALQHAQIGRKDSSGPQGKGWQEGVSFTLDSRAVADVVAFHGSQDPDVAGDVTHPVGRNQGQETCIAFHTANSNMGGPIHKNDCAWTVEPNPTRHAIQTHSAVRRLTPRECERLQGFPDDYTLIPYRNKPAADGPRYKALGNSMAVPVMRWIGERISMVEQMAKEGA